MFTVNVAIAMSNMEPLAKSSIGITDMEKVESCSAYQLKDLLYQHPYAMYANITVLTGAGKMYAGKSKKEESAKIVSSKLYELGKDNQLIEVKNFVEEKKEEPRKMSLHHLGARHALRFIDQDIEEVTDRFMNGDISAKTYQEKHKELIARKQEIVDDLRAFQKNEGLFGYEAL